MPPTAWRTVNPAAAAAFAIAAGLVLIAGAASVVAIREARQGYWTASGVAMVGNALALVLLGFAAAALRRTMEQRAAAERALRASEERFRVTLQSIGDAVLATDDAGRIVFLNDAAERLTGWGDADAQGQPLDAVFRIVSEETRATVASPVATVLRDGVVVGLANHAVLLSRDGRETPIDDCGAPIRDDQERVVGVVLVFRDVSDRRRQDAQRRRREEDALARRAAEQASRAKDEFLAVLSHELRSPLQGILGWMTVLNEPGVDAAQRQRALSAIERGLREQAQLVSDILDASRIVAGKLRIERAPVRLADVVQECIETALPLATEKHLALESEVARGGLVLGDRSRLQQAVSNVLMNAIKFTPPGGHIEARCFRDGAHLVVVVRDSGDGIAAEFLPHVFDRFTQGYDGPSPAAAGLGLGLSIVREILELHGGSIAAESDGVGRGATFTLQLPLADGLDDDAVRNPTAPTRAVPLEGVSLVLVDDDQETREALGLLLSLRGARVRDAASVADALLACRAEPPAVVVSDIGMPDADGYSLVAALRSDPRWRAVRAVALTGFASADDRRQAEGAGFDAHLSKPVDIERLVATIARLCASRPGDAGL